MPEGAVARRTRRLKIYGIVLLLGAACAVVYCATRPGFDLSTPQSALDTFERAMEERRWSVAEKCLSDRCRGHYAAAITDRSLFDFYSPDGYIVTEGQTFRPKWEVGKIEVKENTARARIAANLPLLGGEQFGFWLELVKGGDGLWRVDGPRVEFKREYGRLIPDVAKGWAKRFEVR